MRLLVVSQYFWPENFRVNDLVSELGKLGHEITVLTGKPNYPAGSIFPEYKKEPDAYLHYEGSNLIRVPMIPQGTSSIMRLLNYASYAISAAVIGSYHLRGRNFDAIFVFQNSPATVGFPAVILRGLKKAPMAIWVLDQWPETLEAVGVVKSKWMLSVLGKLIKALYKRCDRILVQSKSLETLINKKYSKDSGRVHYFPNWAETIYSSTLAQAAPEVPFMENSFNIVFAGNIGESQDFPTILNAVEKLSAYENIRWLIVGDGRMFNWVKNEVIRRGLENNFLLLGHYPVERMPSFYKHANALLVSLRPESIFSMTLPGKIQSYFAAGIPVVGMLDGEGTNIINEANAGLACPAGDAEALANIVLKLFKMDDADRQQFGQNGLSYSKARFDRQTQIRILEQHLLNMKYHK